MMVTKPSVSISKIEFSGGGSFNFYPNEKIVLVGPNNSGKSQSLREILAISSEGSKARPIVIKNIVLKKEGDLDALINFLESHAEFVNRQYRYKNWQIHENNVAAWKQDFLTSGLTPGFVINITANERLTVCNQKSSISPGEQKSTPQHILYDNSVLMDKISGLFRQSFGKNLMFDFRGGSKLPIHVGTLPPKELTDRVGDEYVQAVRSNPLLDQQGDGMKGYAGLLFQAIVTDLDITLIDEPEAFLHPPQMRRLGETLATEVNGQLIVATHSSDILRGFLEGKKGNVRILRIRRDGDANFVTEASADVIKNLWERPELRYSNALEGIFHEQTIICEDDSDCRLINSVADHLSVNSGENWQDTAYVPTGGKHGVPKIAGVLREIGVPVKAVFDIDFLSEQSLVQSTVEAFGGEWEDIKPLWIRVDAAVRAGNKPKSISEIKDGIISLLKDSTIEGLPKGDVIELMKQNKEWANVKKYGEQAIPNGNAQKDYGDLREKLQKIGVYIIPVGEIENFCREIGSHGPKFVTKLLSSVQLQDARLSDLRAFVERVHKGAHSRLSF